MKKWPHPRSVKAVKMLANLRGAQIGCDAAEAFYLARQIDFENKIFFRFETNFNVGLGHAIRCLSIAKFLRKKNIAFTLSLQKKSYKILKIMNTSDIQSFFINSTKKVEKDAHDTLDIIKKNSLNKKVFIFKDDYSLNLTWDKIIRKKYENLIVIDDFLNRKHDCKFYINFNPYKKKKYNI